MTLDNFKSAFRKARKGRGRNKHVKKILGKRRKGETQEQFAIRRNKRIERFMRHLMWLVETGRFTTSEYETRNIRDPKPRTLYILPLYPDRIVQHAMVNVLQPIWDKLLIHHTYACRKDKGQQKCSQAITKGVKNYKYCALTDIRKFYPSISHDIIFRVVQRKIKDKKMLALLKDVIYSLPGGRNIPIGNLISQHLGNLLLNELDQYVTHELKIKLAPRYMDNKGYFSDDLKYLHKCLNLVENFVNDKLDLELSQKDINRCDNGIAFIGYRHFPEYILLKKRTAKRIKRQLKKLPEELKSKKITIIQYTSKLAACYGHAKHANTYNYRQKNGFRPYVRRRKKTNKGGKNARISKIRKHCNKVRKHCNKVRR